MKRTAKQWKDCYMAKEFHENYYYENWLGAVCSEEGTAFRLWSPQAADARIRLYKEGEGGEPYAAYPMVRKEKGVWEYVSSENLHGTYYDFALELEGESVITADPYARACGLNGRRSMAVDLSRTNPEGWEEDVPPDYGTEQVIYELHVKEFSWDASGGFPEEVRGKYRAFCCPNTTLHGDGTHPTGISYLKELGVTHIQLMPVYDFGSVDEAGDPDGFNWGYDPVNWNVPEGSYSSDPAHGEVRIRELKEAVQSLHRQGFRVIMDVVYNHSYSLDSWLQKTAPWYYYRVWEDGTPSNGSACGNDLASERPMCAKFILDSVLYWAREYHFDGFRFDLMGLLDVGLMNRIRTELDKIRGKGEILLYGEPWAAAPTAMEGGAAQTDKRNLSLLDPGIGIFCDNTRDAVKGSVFRTKEPGFVNGGKGFESAVFHGVKAWCGRRGFGAVSPAQIITYVSAHDNQTLWDKLTDTTWDESRRRKEYRLAAGICMTSQGRPFLLSGEEFERTKGGLEDSYNAPIALNRLDWDRAYERLDLVNYYKGLIALRKQLPALYDKTEHAANRIRLYLRRTGFVGFTADNTDEKNSGAYRMLCILYNRRNSGIEVRLPEGEWEILADGADSFLWKNPPRVSGTVLVAPVSMLVLGRR